MYRLVDVDNHCYEPDDCFTRHLDPAFADRAFHSERGADGVGRAYFGSEPAYEPRRFFDGAGLDEDELRRVSRDSAASLLGLRG